MLIQYLNYLYNSHNLHSVHSPFVYDFNKHVLNVKNEVVEFDAINGYRNELTQDVSILKIDTLGAGSKRKIIDKIAVKAFYNLTCTNHSFGSILYRIIQYYNYNNIIELGTGMGIGTSYMLQALKNKTKTSIYSIEGSEVLFNFTRSQLNKHFSGHNVQLIKGNFDLVLPDILASMPSIDLAFVDGNHSYEATLDYFKMLLAKTNNNSVIIFDDINWSKPMQTVWKEIIQFPEVTCSIDLFRWGLVFFRKEMKKEHFTIRFNGFLKAHIS